MLIVSMTLNEPGSRPCADSLLRGFHQPQDNNENNQVVDMLKRENEELKAAYSKTVQENRILQVTLQHKTVDSNKLLYRRSALNNRNT